MAKTKETISSKLPQAPISRLAKPVMRFLHIQAASGVVLLLCTFAALILANSSIADAFLQFWKTKVGFSFGDFEFRHSLKHLVNDGLMAIFFFVIGLEVKRELVLGELRDMRRAALPVAAALGGMIAPALIYWLYMSGGEGQRGWGIPMATDIAFVVGCMAIFGSRVPHSLRIMMLSLAIADDIGAILVIAIGYTSDLNITWLGWGFAGIGAVFAIARLGVRSFPVYTAFGIFVWFAFHDSAIPSRGPNAKASVKVWAGRYWTSFSFVGLVFGPLFFAVSAILTRATRPAAPDRRQPSVQLSTDSC